jgi:hypothetical protein
VLRDSDSFELDVLNSKGAKTARNKKNFASSAPLRLVFVLNRKGARSAKNKKNFASSASLRLVFVLNCKGAKSAKNKKKLCVLCVSAVSFCFEPQRRKERKE